MRRKLIITGSIIALFVIGSTKGSARDNEFGFRGGYQMSSLYKSDSSKIDNNLNSVYLGFYRDIKLVSVLKLGLGLEYSQGGSSVDKENNHKLHYVTIPVNLKAKIGPVYALTGTGANILLSETYLENGEKRDAGAGETSSGFDMPFYIGAGAQIAVVGIEVRYHWGLLDLRDDVYNRYLQVGLTLSF